MKKTLIAIIILATIGFFACSKKDMVDTSANDIEDVNSKATFEERIASGVSIAFFHASWCDKCAEQRPAFEAASMRKDLDFVTFIEVEHEENPDIKDKYDVPGFPTMVIFKDGVEKDRLGGKGHSEQEIVEALLKVKG